MSKTSKLGQQAIQAAQVNTDARSNIFASTESPAAMPLQSPSVEEAVGNAIRGRPKELPADAIKSTVTLFNSQVVWTQHLSASIREKSKSIVDRSAIIRAILTATINSGIDLRDCKTEDEVTQAIQAAIGAAKAK
jgi:hypothetical protein